MGISQLCKKIYFKTTGYSYTNLGRMFLRLFTGIMLMQCAVRTLAGESVDMNSEMGVMFGFTEMPVVIAIIETVCSFFIMLGFLTRIMLCPLLILMIVSCHLCVAASGSIMSAMLPFMFLGIYSFLLLVGPGKISVDYFYALHLIGKEDGNEVFELEEV